MEVPVPPGEELMPVEGSSYFNDRYALYIAEQLGDRIAEEVAAYRLDPRPYSTDLVAAWEVLEQWKLNTSTFADLGLWRQNGYWRCELFVPSMQWTAWGDTAPHAICLAALTAIEEVRWR